MRLSLDSYQILIIIAFVIDSDLLFVDILTVIHIVIAIFIDTLSVHCIVAEC